jgi:hypothetical protein
VVQIVENWADVEARVLSVRDDPSRPGARLASLEVTAVHDVASFPNLLKHAAGSRLDVVVPETMPGSIDAGSVVRCRVRRAGPSAIFAHAVEVAR